MKAKKILQTAKEQDYALGAFNAANIEILKSITNAAKKLKSPIILEASDGEINYIGIKQFVALAKIYEQEIGVPIILNLDHAKTFETCKQAIDAGFDYVHFDGSALDLEENIRITKEVVKYAHSKDLLVEGEMDHIQGSSDDHRREDPNKILKESMYTVPERAESFVKATGIDVFASFIGNMHGVFAYSERLRLDILKRLGQLLPETYFSLHGGSGLNDDDVRAAIKLGIVKVNVNTEMRIAFKDALKESLNQKDDIAIYKLTPPAILAVQKVVETKILLFGSGEVKYKEEVMSIL